MKSQTNYEQVAEAIRWVTEHQQEQPDLAQLATHLEVSPAHLQRTFQAWAGISPKQFLKSLTRQAALERLKAGSSVMEASFEAGLSGPGRLHDLLISTEALTPGEARRSGRGVQLKYGTGETPFGPAVIAWTDRGINFLGFCADKGKFSVVEEMKSGLPAATWNEDPPMASEWLQRVFEPNGSPLPLWLRGSPFQLKVWEALMAIPESTHSSYGDVAKSIGQPAASRAVGTAIGKNPVAFLIPCHRVIRLSGELGGYRWGTGVKSALVGYESCKAITPEVASP